MSDKRKKNKLPSTIPFSTTTATYALIMLSKKFLLTFCGRKRKRGYLNDSFGFLG